ncbi:hypothetical protein K501DRAFT_279042 [Backusella circina FSU 941]|nr:hypothetical protein K501DRAFT_279042 [Backusella circina FSU 941]
MTYYLTLSYSLNIPLDNYATFRFTNSARFLQFFVATVRELKYLVDDCNTGMVHMIHTVEKDKAQWDNTTKALSFQKEYYDLVSTDILNEGILGFIQELHPTISIDYLDISNSYGDDMIEDNESSNSATEKFYYLNKMEKKKYSNSNKEVWNIKSAFNIKKAKIKNSLSKMYMN